MHSLQEAFEASKPELLKAIMAIANDPARSPPQVTVLSIAQRQNFSLGDNVTLCFRVNQPSNYSYSINNKENITVAGNTTLTGIPAGNQSLIIYAQNIVGKTGKSQPVNFTVIQPIQLEAKPFENTSDVPLIYVVAGACLSAALGLTSAVFYWKSKKRIF
jgi:hypothetical protein